MRSGSRFRPTPKECWRAWGIGSTMRSRLTTSPRSWSVRRALGERRSVETDSMARTIRVAAQDWRWATSAFRARLFRPHVQAKLHPSGIDRAVAPPPDQHTDDKQIENVGA